MQIFAYFFLPVYSKNLHLLPKLVNIKLKGSPGNVVWIIDKIGSTLVSSWG